ncbi:tyrosine-type recombinase/integrase [Halorussus limi]|uniref:Tyrosine-type recombinase/integrase n=1 Tax=Halorussus limi TaxID=2938695 RepID=A0A8U0HSE0_9EURY|nr:tyrosine-type recombinase/integrase [Halorussus limi]UPV73731.1 tyrosine-type recombinase/integrase [Halorussus limi]
MDSDTAISLFHNRQTNKKADSTANRYTQVVQDFAEWLENPGEKDYDPNLHDREPKSIWEATTGYVEVFLEQLLQNGGYTGGSIGVRETALSVFYQELEEIDRDPRIDEDLPSTENPIEDLDLSDWESLKNGTKKKQEAKGPTYLEPDEIRELANNVPSPIPRNDLIVRLLYHTGLRRGELVNIQLDDLDTERRTIDVHAEKTHQNRTVRYQSSLDTAMTRWLNVERKALATAGSDYLFPTSHSERIDPNHVNRMIKKAADNAGLQKYLYTDAQDNDHDRITAHVIRHSYAVQCIKNGMDTRRLQKLMGHSKIETTEKYLQFTDKDLLDAARTYGAGTELGQ